MLHILNGESTESTLGHTSVAGSRFSFRDALIEGPAPAVNGAEWRRLRAAHIAEAYGAEKEKCERDLQRQDEVFASFKDHDEVTLWFESDLFCQSNLLYVLDWCARHDLGATKLSLICIGEFPGRPNFRGLGELNPDELASLFPGRTQVTEDQLGLGMQAWQAYRSDDPRELERLLQADTESLLFLESAVQLHLERFPSVRNGLNRIELKTLELIESGVVRFGDLFPRFIDAEPAYGYGDAQFWNSLQRLMRGPSPLLINQGVQPGAKRLLPELPAPEAFGITEAGKAVLKNAADFIQLNGIDEWLGGVHLQGPTNIWRWDEADQRLVRP